MKHCKPLSVSYNIPATVYPIAYPCIVARILALIPDAFWTALSWHKYGEG